MQSVDQPSNQTGVILTGEKKEKGVLVKVHEVGDDKVLFVVCTDVL